MLGRAAPTVADSAAFRPSDSAAFRPRPGYQGTALHRDRRGDQRQGRVLQLRPLEDLAAAGTHMCIYTMPASSTPHPRLVGRGACSPRAMASALCRPQPAARCAMAPLRVRCALTCRRSSKCTVAARRSPAPTSSPCSRMPEARMDHVHGPQSQRERAGDVSCLLSFVFICNTRL